MRSRKPQASSRKAMAHRARYVASSVATRDRTILFFPEAGSRDPESRRQAHWTIFSESSMSCSMLTFEGASVIASVAFWVFGKAMTSRIDGAPVMIMIRRSKPKAMPPCGGVPYSQGVEQEPELAARIFRTHPQRLEELLLDLGAVDPDAAAADLGPVEDQIVGPGPALCAGSVSRSGRSSATGDVKG